jgi:hypothetical protein
LHPTAFEGRKMCGRKMNGEVDPFLVDCRFFCSPSFCLA